MSYVRRYDFTYLISIAERCQNGAERLAMSAREKRLLSHNIKHVANSKK